MSATTVREALLRVTALIEGGWIRGRSHKTRYGRDCYCLSGALDKIAAEGSLVPRERVADAMRGAITRQYPHRFLWASNIVEFNDAHGRTKAQVLAMLRDAVEHA